MGTGSCIHVSKAAGLWSWPLTNVWRYAPIFMTWNILLLLHFMVQEISSVLISYTHFIIPRVFLGPCVTLIHTVDSVSIFFITHFYPQCSSNFICTGCIFSSILVIFISNFISFHFILFLSINPYRNKFRGMWRWSLIRIMHIAYRY
jgi:hypothetical protein